MINPTKPSIAILGTRGIPARYGGFETFAQELSTRLVKKGFEVTVYCRKGNSDDKMTQFQGVKLVTLPTIRHKYFDTIAHAFLSVWHVSLFCNIKIVYICNAINSLFAIIPRLFGKTVIINVDGLEWKRTKWNCLGKQAYRISERLATWFAHIIISDSQAIQAYYKEKFRRDTVFISYGAQRVDVLDSLALVRKLGLEDRKYILYVSRLEPENNAHIMIQAYEQVNTLIPLVIVGHAPYGQPYVEQLRSTQDPRIKFLGGVYGEGYYALQSHAYAYLHGNEVGGTNPALLEAMAFGNCVIAIGVPFNQEVVGEAGLCFRPHDAKDLANILTHLLANPAEVERYRCLAPQRIQAHYNWEAVVEKYENLFIKMLNNIPKKQK
jgi:glycosyltransferase involved in cell wall biosynthesis